MGSSTSPNGEPSLAAQVCAACKARKKKCDKLLPRCGFCARKGLDCAYDYDSPSPNSGQFRAHHTHVTAAEASPAVPALGRSLALPRTISIDPIVTGDAEATLYTQVQAAIRKAGLFLDDASARYFRGLHCYLPIVSRNRFHQDLTTLGATPSADFSCLLLAICLISSCPSLERRTPYSVQPGPSPEFDSLYLTTKSALAQVQALIPPSLYLIQAATLVSLYEYVSGHPDRALASLAHCIRMAYEASLHTVHEASAPSLANSASIEGKPPNYQLHYLEAANTWWGLVVCERTFYCDISVSTQPLVTVTPSPETPLPTEPLALEQAYINGVEPAPVSLGLSLGCNEVASFGRSAQAAIMVDHIMTTLRIEDADRRLMQLQQLDITIQQFLQTLLAQADMGRKSCQAVTITLRGLYTLHWHILDLASVQITRRERALEEWQKSHIALDSITKIVLDVVDAVESGRASSSICVAPSYSFLVRAALQHVYKKSGWKQVDWLKTAEERLRSSLLFLHRDGKFSALASEPSAMYQGAP